MYISSSILLWNSVLGIDVQQFTHLPIEKHLVSTFLLFHINYKH